MFCPIASVSLRALGSVFPQEVDLKFLHCLLSPFSTAHPCSSLCPIGAQLAQCPKDTRTALVFSRGGPVTRATFFTTQVLLETPGPFVRGRWLLNPCVSRTRSDRGSAVLGVCADSAARAVCVRRLRGSRAGVCGRPAGRSGRCAGAGEGSKELVGHSKMECVVFWVFFLKLILRE